MKTTHPSQAPASHTSQGRAVSPNPPSFHAPPANALHANGVPLVSPGSSPRDPGFASSQNRALKGRHIASLALAFALAACALPSLAVDIDYYWVGLGANANINQTANWKIMSGGTLAPAMTIPGDRDSMNFDGQGSGSEMDLLANATLNAGQGIKGFRVTGNQTRPVSIRATGTGRQLRIFGNIGVSTLANPQPAFIMEAGAAPLSFEGAADTGMLRLVMGDTVMPAAPAFFLFRNDNPSGGNAMTFGQYVLFTLGGGNLCNAVFDGTGDFILNGRYVVSSSPVIYKRGSGILTLAGDNSSVADNPGGFGIGASVLAGVVLEQGTLNINHLGALGTGTFTIRDGVTFDNTSGAAITSRPNPVISIQGDFTFKGSNNLVLGTGRVDLAGPRRTITVAAGRLAMNGQLNGAGITLAKTGAGDLALGGSNDTTYSGTTLVTAGFLFANGSIRNSNVIVGNNAGFGGSGTAGIVTMNPGSTLSPGDLSLIVSDTSFSGTIGTTSSVLKIDKSLSGTDPALTLAAGVKLEFALGKGKTSTSISAVKASGVSSPTIAFSNNVIKIIDLAGGAAEPGSYTIFKTDGAFNDTFTGLTVDPLTDEITAGLSVDAVSSDYARPNFGYRLTRAPAGIILRLFERPVISATGQIAVLGWTFFYAVPFNSDTETTSITGLPAGLAYDPLTRTISGSPTAAPGIYNATITATNPAATVTQTLAIDVRAAMPAPVFTTDPVITRPANAPFKYDITANNLPQSFTIISGMPSWMTFTQNPSSGTWSLSGTPPAGGGTWTLTIEAANPSGNTRTTLTIIIANSTRAPVIFSATSVVWAQNQPFDYQIQADNSPAFFGVTGAPPAGVTFNPLTGAFAGAPTALGVTTMTMSAINTTGTDTKPLRVEVIATMSQPQFTTPPTALAYLNQPFTFTFAAEPYVNSCTVTNAASLPSWLSWNPRTATLSGTCVGDPATWAISGSSWPVIVEARNSVGVATGTLTVTVKQYYPVPVITNSRGATCFQGRPWSEQITVNTTAALESYSANGLPAGLAVDTATGLVSGVPTQTGDFTLTLGATTSGGTGTKPFLLSVIPIPPGPFINSPAQATGLVGQSFSYQITAETPVVTYGANGLPRGLSVNPQTGLISGTPAAGGYYAVEITTTDANGTFTATIILAIGTTNSSLLTYAGALQTPGFVNATGTAARFDQPAGAAINASSGSVYIADSNNGAIRVISTTSDVSSYILGLKIGTPGAMTTDSQGNIYYADSQNNAIKQVLALDKTVWTAAYALSAPGGVAVDSSDNVYFTDGGNHAIKKIAARDGTISTIAGNGAPGSLDGDAATATFNAPAGLVCDRAANKLYVADTLNSTLRSIDLATGAVSTIAGSAGYDGNIDGTGSTVRFRTPEGLAIDNAGFLYIADTGNSTIRICDPKTGFVLTIAGAPRETGAIDGDGVTARMTYPSAVVVDTAGTGDVFVVDTGNSAIRVLLSKPYIFKLLESATVTPGANLTLDGRAWGSPVPAYAWFKDGVQIPNAHAETLALKSVKASDAGAYEVVATNATGTTSSIMELTVATSGGGGEGGGGGGGSTSLWFLLALGALLGVRWQRARQRPPTPL